MNDWKTNRIINIKAGSIAEEIGLQCGDILHEINGTTIHDIIDYKYALSDEYIEILVEDENGEMTLYEIEKEFDEDLGIGFSQPLIEDAKSCANKCVFCFIDQLPKGMRETLYFKDDDSRLSFLQGNFVTLTNVSDEAIDRMIRFRLSPVKISVHTTNPELRVEMLKNPKAAKIMEQLQKFYDAQLTIQAQIVLVRGMNDKDELTKTIQDLVQFHPYLESVAIVPVGLTKHRDHLPQLDAFGKEEALEVIQQVEELQQAILNTHHTRFCYVSDEFYALADLDFPTHDAYEGYPQIENGVGLVRNLEHEFSTALKEIKTVKQGKYAILCGTLVQPYLESICKTFTDRFPDVSIDVIAIKNDFFGHTVTVSGLLTGQDLLAQFSESEKYDTIFISKNMLRAESDVFLDDITVDDINEQWKTPLVPLEVNGEVLVKALAGRD